MTTAFESSWGRLHPASVVVNLIPRAWATVQNAWPLLIALVYGQAMGETLLFLTLSVVFLVMTLGSSLVHFLTLRYRVHGNKLEIRSGLLNRQVRVIQAERVQNVEMIRNIFHRMSGLVEVRVETASGSEIEGFLSALSVDDATGLIHQIETARRRTPVGVPDASEAPGETFWANGPIQILWYGATSVRLGLAAIILGVVYELFLARSIGQGNADVAVLRRFGMSGGFVVAVGAVAGAWFLGILGTFVRYWGFALTRRKRQVIAESGLFTRRRIVLPPRKVQSISLVEPFVRRLLGFCSVRIHTAAARPSGDGTQQSQALVPYVDRNEWRTVVDRVLPRKIPNVPPEKWRPAAPAEHVRALLSAAFRWTMLCAALAWAFWPWGLASVALVPVAMFVAGKDVAFQRWHVDEHFVISRKGWLTRSTRLLDRDKIQSTMAHQGPIYRRYGLGVVVLRVAGQSVRLPAMAWSDATSTAQRLLRKEAS